MALLPKKIALFEHLLGRWCQLRRAESQKTVVQSTISGAVSASFRILQSSNVSVFISRKNSMASETRTSNVDTAIAAPDPQLLPEEQHKGVPVLPVRDTVLFPHAVLPLTVGRESSIQLINSLGEEKTILVVAQREARVDA